jgi:hypothetical protein
MHTGVQQPDMQLVTRKIKKICSGYGPSIGAMPFRSDKGPRLLFSWPRHAYVIRVDSIALSSPTPHPRFTQT